MDIELLRRLPGKDFDQLTFRVNNRIVMVFSPHDEGLGGRV